MNRRRISQVVAVVIMISVVIAAGSTAVAASSAGVASAPEATCEGSGLNAVLDDGTTEPDHLRVVSGTPISVVYCESGDAVSTDDWELHGPDEVDGIEENAGEDEEYAYRLETEEVTGTEEVELSVDGEDASITLAVENPGVTVSHLDETVDFDEAPDGFTEAVDDYETAQNETDDLIEAFEDGDVSGDPIADYEDQEIRLTEASKEIEDELLTEAFDGVPGAYAAYSAQIDDQEAMTDELSTIADGYVEQTEDEASDDRLLLVGAFLGPVLLGTILGVGGGRRLTRSKLETVRRQRRRDANVEYGPFNLARAIVGSVLAVVTAIGVLAVTGIHGPIIEVLL
ncbi:hypothetical protein JCM17823_07160 [Halorubrum gandharaense]